MQMGYRCYIMIGDGMIIGQVLGDNEYLMDNACPSLINVINIQPPLLQRFINQLLHTFNNDTNNNNNGSSSSVTSVTSVVSSSSMISLCASLVSLRDVIAIQPLSSLILSYAHDSTILRPVPIFPPPITGDRTDDGAMIGVSARRHNARLEAAAAAATAAAAAAATSCAYGGETGSPTRRHWLTTPVWFDRDHDEMDQPPPPIRQRENGDGDDDDDDSSTRSQAVTHIRDWYGFTAQEVHTLPSSPSSSSSSLALALAPSLVRHPIS